MELGLFVPMWVVKRGGKGLLCGLRVAMVVVWGGEIIYT